MLARKAITRTIFALSDFCLQLLFNLMQFWTIIHLLAKCGKYNVQVCNYNFF